MVEEIVEPGHAGSESLSSAVGPLSQGSALTVNNREHMWLTHLGQLVEDGLERVGVHFVSQRGNEGCCLFGRVGCEGS